MFQREMAAFSGAQEMSCGTRFALWRISLVGVALTRGMAIAADCWADRDQPAASTPQDLIQVVVSEKDDPNTVWQQYFAANKPSPQAVREAVRKLMNESDRQPWKRSHVIALIEAALRHGQVQPWMYEALVIAMQADNRPAEEIERAVMSAAEFAQNSMDLMYLGVYLTRMGLDARALKMFRQVSLLEPGRPEPYMHGLRAAQRLKDIEGIKWATLGILGQEWPREQVEVARMAVGAAREVMDQLRSAGRTQELESYQQALMEALRRDCVVVVKWTGDADVDVMVEEPSGTVCSLRNPRTTAGGMMHSDPAGEFGSEGSNVHVIRYVCPRGFDGTYRVLIRRVFGKVTAGKVSVDVYTQDGPSGGRHVGKKLALERDEALVVFDLQVGRRKENLQEHQVANAAVAQAAVRQGVARHILAQQLAAAADPAALQNFAASRSMSGSMSNLSMSPFVVGWRPVVGRGAVGYQPVIITLPEGANLAATAVISADRRYVRITCVPLFSGIAEVHTFNMASGDVSRYGAGTGGQGYGGLFGPGQGGGQPLPQPQPQPAPAG